MLAYFWALITIDKDSPTVYSLSWRKAFYSIAMALVNALLALSILISVLVLVLEIEYQELHVDGLRRK
jgi:hypothetical protein